MGKRRDDRAWSGAGSVRVLGLVVVVALVVGACGGDDDEQVGASAKIEFLTGEIADSVPGDFPIPDQAVIGLTVVNRNLDPVFTEMTLRVSTEIAGVAQYYATNLPPRDYEIKHMDTDGAGRLIIEFSRDGSDARIQLTDLGNDITSVLVQFNPTEE